MSTEAKTTPKKGKAPAKPAKPRSLGDKLGDAAISHLKEIPGFAELHAGLDKSSKAHVATIGMNLAKVVAEHQAAPAETPKATS